VQRNPVVVLRLPVAQRFKVEVVATISIRVSQNVCGVLRIGVPPVVAVLPSEVAREPNRFATNPRSLMVVEQVALEDVEAVVDAGVDRAADCSRKNSVILGR